MKNETKEAFKWYASSYGKLAIGGILSCVGALLTLSGAHMSGAQDAIIGMYATDAEATMNTVNKLEEQTNR